MMDFYLFIYLFLISMMLISIGVILNAMNKNLFRIYKVLLAIQNSNNEPTMCFNYVFNHDTKCWDRETKSKLNRS